MDLTPFHAKYYAYELTKRSSSYNVEKLASTLVDAQVDINPHQVEAALFAFRSPLSKGAILADEVGLGKTIEAGLVISQKWAERKRKILVIAPANLRKQWSMELLDKFFLPSIILEAKSFKEFIKGGNHNPFSQNSILVCSFQFAKSKEIELKEIGWDLVVIDEAHRLRNVYKTANKIARSLKDALKNVPKILLTATPLQNSLLELFGLVSIVDEYAFGDLESFKSQFGRISNTADSKQYAELKNRMRSICHRTLRRQVQEYVPFTNRIALMVEYDPTIEESQLYKFVSDYLQSDSLYALPAGQRQLMTLILRRLLASSSYAISGTLERLAKKLESKIQANEDIDDKIVEDFETYEELKEEWDEDDIQAETRLSALDIENIKDEIEALRKFETLAKSIKSNSKGENLFTALSNGFAELERLKAPKKAIIFTESKRTQEYLSELLENRGYSDQVVLFNGSNSDGKSDKLYKEWRDRNKDSDRLTGSKTVDIRAALVDHFRNNATIMIATEAAAEGINLQFCSLIINYDLPWNPQRIEQRIGRCHRYGQKFDVVVVNFLNRQNAADQRVFKLLRDKFQLFNGVFGSSDEVLGSIESGVDFEKRIASIYQNCRTTEQIENAFNQLQSELEESISGLLEQTRQNLLENFDEEVHEKLRINVEESKSYLSKYENWLWSITKFKLNSHADFSPIDHSFVLKNNPFPDNSINIGLYQLGKPSVKGNVYRIGHNLAQHIIEDVQKMELPISKLTFNYRGKLISVLEPLIGKTGWLLVMSMTISTFDNEDFLVLTGATSDGNILDADQCHRLFSLQANVEPSINMLPQHIETRIEESYKGNYATIIKGINNRNLNFFEQEIDKLDKWGDDKRASLKLELRDLDEQIKVLKKQIRISNNLSEKLQFEKERKKLEAERDKSWHAYDAAATRIELDKDKIINKIEQQLEQSISEKKLFMVEWELKK
jgi:ERCC4-related helicase